MPPFVPVPAVNRLGRRWTAALALLLWQAVAGVAAAQGGPPPGPLGQAVMAHARAILGLAQDGRPSMDDAVGRFFDGVPADKAGITIGQLMDGASGLPNFHAPQTDGDAVFLASHSHQGPQVHDRLVQPPIGMVLADRPAPGGAMRRR